MEEGIVLRKCPAAGVQADRREGEALVWTVASVLALRHGRGWPDVGSIHSRAGTRGPSGVQSFPADLSPCLTPWARCGLLSQSH